MTQESNTMGKRFILITWALLLVPTVLLSGLAIRLLQHEEERMAQVASRAASDRAELTAEAVKLCLRGIEDDLMRTLMDLPPLEEAKSPASPLELIMMLRNLQETNPLVRNVFVWSPQSGLSWPRPLPEGTPEESQFVSRYEALFSGRTPWPTVPLDETASASQSPSFFSRNPQTSTPNPQPSSAQAWIPWFQENRLYILGWRRTSQGWIYGLELEQVALLSRLISVFPQKSSQGSALALLDGSGQVFHQVGDISQDTETRPDVRVPLAPFMPHWEVAVTLEKGQSPSGAGHAFFLLGSLVLATCLTGILLGGTLLTWQALRERREARQKTSFVSNVSHELKTPLTTIRMYAELLQENRIQDDEKRKRYLDVIASESQRLTRLVNNVLDFSRLEQGRKKYQKEKLDLRELVQGILEDHRAMIDEAGLVLRTEVPVAPLWGLADRDAVGQALLNLVDNAVKYARTGGALDVTVSRKGTRAEVSVLDKGPGVPASHQERIFERFYRVDQTLTAGQPGSGLGLTIARRLLRDLGGDLVYQDRPGGGSIFTLVLPLVSEEVSS